VARPQPPPWLPIDQAPDLAREALDSAGRSLAAGNSRDALRAAGWAWHYHRYLREAYEVGGRAAKEAGESELSRALIGIVSDPNHPGPWLQAGWALVDEGWSDLAIPLLEEAYRIEPDNLEARESLIIAYSDEGRHEEVVALASVLNPMERPSVAFPLAWSALMNRRIELAERSLACLGKVAESAVEARGVYAKAAAALERYRAFPPENDIRHWHFIQYGGLTLDLCDDLDLAGGRYNLVSLTYEQIGAVLRALLAAGREIDVPLGPWGFLNRDGEILARALAEITGRPAVPGMPAEGWVVMGDPRDLGPRADELAVSGPHLRTFAFAFPWMIWGPKVVDVTGMWVELAVLPWNGGWRHVGGAPVGASTIGAGTPGVREVLLDRRSPETIAADVAAAAAKAADPTPALLEFTRVRRTALTLVDRQAIRGLPYVPDAPLPFASLSGVLG
jgi:tetratricopeptide (TPR) repeat protein